jgi:hypothetical protein
MITVTIVSIVGMIPLWRPRTGHFSEDTRVGTRSPRLC